MRLEVDFYRTCLMFTLILLNNTCSICMGGLSKQNYIIDSLILFFIATQVKP